MIFLGCLFEREKEGIYMQKSRCGISNAVNGYQWNLIEGFNSNLEESVSIVNALPVGIWPKQYNDLVLPTRSWEHNGAKNIEIGCLNLPFIKQHQRYLGCKRAIKRSGQKKILIYSAYLPFLKAVRRLDKSYEVTLVVTDLPEFYDLGKTSSIRKIFRNINNKKIQKCLKRVDKFVLLTEQMKYPLKVGDREYTVVEGICDPDMFSALDVKQETSKEKTILYTGTLHEKFGIMNLVEAFMQIESPDYRLVICGGGDSQARIEDAAKKDERIQFLGYQQKSRITELQGEATVLINPRQNNEEYTKYSFPSKTMEYMLSGKPVIMYKLDGIPEEYDEYLQYVESDSVEALKNKMVEICELSQNERDRIGERAKAFVSENKNRKKQTNKILELMDI